MPLPILLRDAQPTLRDIAWERDKAKRKERERARDNARADLMRMYRQATGRGALATLDRAVRGFCEALIARHPKIAEQARKARKGAPTQDQRSLRIAVDVQEKIDDGGGKRGSIDAAINAVADALDLAAGDADCRAYDRVRKIYYAADKRAVRAEISRRKLEAWQKANPDAACAEFEKFMQLPKPKTSTEKKPLKRPVINKAHPPQAKKRPPR